MEAGEALRRFKFCRDRGDRQRRRIRGENAISRDDRLEFAEHLPLDLEIFDDRFDHRMAGLEIGQRVDDLDARQSGRGILLAHAAFFGRALQHLADKVARLLGGACARVHHQHVDTARGGNLHNAAPHRAGAEHADRQIGPVRIECHQFPLNTGLRFSMNAVCPSM